MIFPPGPHDGALLDILGPDPGTPVTHRQEVLMGNSREQGSGTRSQKEEPQTGGKRKRVGERVRINKKADG